MKINNIAKNTSYFTLALILQKVISFSYFTLLARNLDPANLGKYYLAISFATIFSIFIDIGLSNVLTREIAKKQEESNRLLGNVLVLKIPLAFVVGISVFLLSHLFNYPELTRHLIYLATICVILDSFTVSFWAVLRGHHNLKFESIASVLFQLIVLGLGFSAIKFGFGLRIVILALVFASTFNFIFSSSILRYKLCVKLRPQYSRALLKRLLLLTAPFALYGIFNKLYLYLDTVLLSLLAGDTQVGLYQISFKIVFALQFLPMAFVASLYPAFSQYFKENKDQLVITFERALSYLIIISFPITVGIITLADKIIDIFKPEYRAAIEPLQIIIGSIIFIFLNYPIGALLNACDRQKTNTINMAITLFASIILNLILIPRLEATGAALTVLISNILMFVLGLRIVPQIIKYHPEKIIKVIFKVFTATMTMGFLIIYLKTRLNIFLIIPISAVFYFILLIITKAVRKEDVMSIIRSLKGNR